MSVPRVTFFADSFYEVNGVARTSREFARFARDRNYPFFSVHAGAATRHTIDGSFETFELANRRFVVRLEAGLSYDLAFLRNHARLRDALARFQPDLIHITGPSHCGILGALLAYQLGIPLTASWHTNLHEYAARRLKKLLHWLPAGLRETTGRTAEGVPLSILVWFYKLAKLLFAPNPELIHLLATKTQRPTYPMYRGIDTQLFAPHRRKRRDDAFVIGYVGRLSTEKNVRMLASVERVLSSRGLTDYRFLVVGDGVDRLWLRNHVQRCQLPGVLLGEELANAYASMDAFVFPSSTDIFGNVILEAFAWGVPAVVSAHSGPKYLVERGLTGFIAQTAEEYAACLLAPTRKSRSAPRMSNNERHAALSFSWPAVSKVCIRPMTKHLPQRPPHTWENTTESKRNFHLAVI